MKVKLLSRVQLLATPWTAAHQAPPSMGFSRQEYWSGLPLPSPITKYIVMILVECKIEEGSNVSLYRNFHWKTFHSLKSCYFVNWDSNSLWLDRCHVQLKGNVLVCVCLLIITF